MAYNPLTVTRQTPYVVNNYTGFVKKKNDGEDSSNPSLTTKTFQHHEEPQQQPQVDQNHRNDAYQELLDSKASHRAAVESRDANIKNATVNIAQIIKDFKNTAKAIGSPSDLMDEVNIYLALIEKQVVKETPDAKLIRSNLKNAASLLDNYISETLQRPSKVVENWLDALFLQRINFKFNEEEVNPQFLVKFPGQKNEEDSDNNSQEDEEESEEQENNKKSDKSSPVPKDEKLKSLFLKAKKFAYANDSKKAMGLFKNALERAIEVSDKETESKILFEIGKIYDKNDYLAQALTSYNKSLIASTDVNVKTQAHYSMAQIYDDVNQFDSAINHYMSSISFAGSTDNLAAQSTSLVKIGNILSDEYKKEAFDFLLEAEKLIKQTKNSKIKGFTSGNIANAYNKFNEPQKALKYYSNAIKEYDDANVPDKVAVNYKRAAELMQDFDNSNKAKALYRKALVKAKQTDDSGLIKEIHQALIAC